MEIRRAVKEDMREASEIHRKSIAREPYNIKVTDEQSLSFIEDCNKEHVMYVASENKILGFVIGFKYRYVDGWRLWVYEIHVSRKSQGKGIGERLINAIEEHFKKEGIKVSELIAPCPHVMEFYKKQNYKKTKYVMFEKKI